MAGNDLGSLLGGLLGGGQGGPLGGLLDMITKQAVPDETLDKVAADAGVSRDEVADQVARELPQVVDKLTPQGQVPSATSLEDLVKQQRL
ncbi:YidB family protein [Streptomyces sp. NPDC050844]|uniref:YidB family protein n=1 Tax=Streptomyces sp. NPDC050844 TaxID=3155790 RepID=UPI0033F1DE4C